MYRNFDRGTMKFRVVFIAVISIITFFVCFGVYNYSKSENITIKVKDKRVFTTTSGDKNSVSSTTHYRIVTENGEYFDCVTFSFNPTSTEKLYNSFDIGHIMLKSEELNLIIISETLYQLNNGKHNTKRDNEV